MAITFNKKSIFRSLIAVFLFVTICSSVLASSISRPSSSVKSLFVKNEPLVLELDENDGDWLIETESDRILFLSFPDTKSSQNLKDSLTIYDGLGQVDPLPSSFLFTRWYSTGNGVRIRFRPSPALLKTPIKYQLKIQKAVRCSSNIGSETHCGRIVDDVSCYCVTYTLRNWENTKTFCVNNNMTFLKIDSFEEDNAVYRTYASIGTDFWIGASDVDNEGVWIWDNGGQPMYPGYENWLQGEPNDDKGDEDCANVRGSKGFGWNDEGCDGLTHIMGGVCESQP